MLRKQVAGLLWSVTFSVLIQSTSLHAETAVLTKCSEDLFTRIETADASRFTYPENLAGLTMNATLIASFAVLLAKQTGEQLGAPPGEPSPLFSGAFYRTLPLDVLLTISSHVLGLNKIPYEKVFTPKIAQEVKIGFMSLFATGGIAIGWQSSPTPTTLGTVCVAAGFCYVVYKALFPLKNWLFKTIPINQDRRAQEQLSNAHPDEYGSLLEASRDRVRQLNKEREAEGKAPLSEQESEDMMLAFLDGLILAAPYEDLIPPRSALWLDPKIKGLAGRLRRTRTEIDNTIKKLKTQTTDISDEDIKVTTKKLAQKLVKQRRQLVHRLLEIYDLIKEQTDDGYEGFRTEILDILKLSDHFAPDFNLTLQRSFDERSRRRNYSFFGLAAIDQFAAVYIAGGYGLYPLNYWQEHGRLPWYYDWFFNLLTTSG